jgi:pyrroloquinoline quinone biosynthesis protein A
LVSKSLAVHDFTEGSIMSTNSAELSGERIINSFKQTSRMFKTDNTLENIMWTTPAATEMRFGFEVTMYVMNK